MFSGIAVHQTVKGMVAMTTAKDGTMQSFYPYAEDNDSSDGQNIIKSVKRTEIASSSFQGIASSPNGCYVTVLGRLVMSFGTSVVLRTSVASSLLL